VHAATSPALDRWAETFATRLAEAAEQFLAARADGRRTVIAGYPWFADWGRDTFVALPGLALATGRWPLAYEVLRTFAGHVDRGMVPNRFPEAGTAPEYNSVDAALWFVEAGRRYVRDSGDLDFARRELLPRIEEILDWYAKGTRYGIRVDPADGLLAAGEEGAALTWMDAVVDGVPVTPRRGKPVEVNALWYNALLSGADIAHSLGQRLRPEAWRDEAERVRESFNRRFWNAEAGYLYDVVDGPAGDDASLRPNQLFAASLFHDVLAEEYRRPVVDAVEARLLTPVGLRTLDPGHPSYAGRYEGPAGARDAAYHNGTVWPWLLGPFAGAYLKAHGRTAEARERVRDSVAPLARHLGTEGCLGQLSEIMDGDPPHTPRGCAAQAWSVAEVARVLLEELRQ
jgi:predicted glycogen debranching enzyme